MQAVQQSHRSPLGKTTLSLGLQVVRSTVQTQLHESANPAGQQPTGTHRASRIATVWQHWMDPCLWVMFQLCWHCDSLGGRPVCN